jgi:glycosyltransferase involved in cell wall biosynthesis
VRPVEWIIVDDGSTDGTREVIEKYAAVHPWIRPKSRTNRGFRQSGAGVVEAFYNGYKYLQSDDWDFVVKLDGDLSFGPDFFVNAFNHFSEQPRLGIGGGTLYHTVKGNMILEHCPRFHVRGATKIYRRGCWRDIGGLERAPGWDIIDEVKANMMGWATESFTDLRVIHHRPTGTAESSWRDAVKNGKGYYFAGYHPLFMAVRCAYRAAHRPYIVGSLGMAYGFVSAFLTRMPQVRNRPLIKYLRRQQLRRLLGAETIWK